jgi:prepilin-type N-terminal cleavage/methylation domain-containing protein
MRRFRSERGVTLIELVLVIIIVGVVGTVVGSILLYGSNAYVQVDTRKDALAEARLGMEIMEREIRQIRSRTAADILTNAATNLQFNDVRNYRIQYQLVGSQINRSETPPASPTATGVLVGNVQSLTFTYLDSTDTATGSPTAIWTVRIDLQVRVGNETVTLRSLVHPRNFI